jgi:hypothetical protein
MVLSVTAPTEPGREPSRRRSDGFEQSRPVLTGDGPNVGLGSRFERVRQDMDAQARPTGVGSHGVRE